MLLTPRVTEYLYRLLADDGVLADRTVLPGGVHRDVLQEDLRAYPAMVVTFLSSAPNPLQTAAIDAFFAVTTLTLGTDIDPLRAPADRADLLVRRIGTTPDVSADGRPVAIDIGDGVKIGNVTRVQEINRTTAEVGQYYAHLGAQYRLSAAEPPLAGQ